MLGNFARKLRLLGFAGLALLALAALIGAAACSETPSGPFAHAGPSFATYFQLPGLEATACQYGGEYPDCKHAPIDWGWDPNFPPPQPTGTTATGTGGSGDPNQPPPPDTARKDTTKPPCNTPAPALNDSGVQAGLAKLWQESNYLAPRIGDRKERMGWLVHTDNGGWAFHEVSVSGNVCGYDGDIPWPPEGLAAIVAFVHTHPYAIGENIPVCNGATTQGLAGVLPYDGTPSDIDRATSVALGEALYGPGHTLPGLILDSRNIIGFNGTDVTKDGAIARCGY